MIPSHLHQRVATIVLAGGEGKRLYPLTQHRCKPDVCFGGKYRLIDIPLSHSLQSRIHQVFVLSQHFTQGLQNHIEKTYPPQVQILTPKSPLSKFEGTADAVRKTKAHLDKTNAEYFLILSGDQLYDIQLLDMIDFAQKKQADLVIASLLVPKKEAKRMGVLQIDPEQKILQFTEKPQTPALLEQFALPDNPSLFLGSMGIYVFRKQVLFDILEEKGDDFGKDIIPKLIQLSQKTYAFIHKGYWEDIGTVESYYKANLSLAKGDTSLKVTSLPTASFLQDTQIEHSVISPGCDIQAKSIVRSIIGSGSIIGQNTIITDSIIMGNHYGVKQTIGKECVIDTAIIDEEVSLGDYVHLRNIHKHQNYDSPQLIVRDGIIIIPSQTVLPRGFCF